MEMCLSLCVRRLIDVMHVHSFLYVNMFSPPMSACVLSAVCILTMMNMYRCFPAKALYALAYMYISYPAWDISHCASHQLTLTICRMWQVFLLLASLATLSLVTVSQMAGQLCALICDMHACVCVCVCVSVRVFKQLSLSRILITNQKQNQVIKILLKV